MPTRTKDRNGLTFQERAFVYAYVGPARGNGTQAARLAGYHGTGQVLSIQAVRLLARDSVKAAIARHQQREERAAIATADEIDETLSKILRAKVRVGDRIAAARELNKVSGRHSVKIQVEGRLTLEQALAESRK